MKKAAKPGPKRKAKREPEPDVNQLAQNLVRMSRQQERPVKTGRPVLKDEISRVMAELGRRGGKVGGKARAAGMSPERRREIALKAARSRWDAAQNH
jgi:hypothetical protein